MRLSKEDLEKLLSIVEGITGTFGINILEKIKRYIKSLISGISEVDRTILARVKLRISNEIDRLSSMNELKLEEKIRLSTLEEVIKIIKEEENKRDLYDVIIQQ